MTFPYFFHLFQSFSNILNCCTLHLRLSVILDRPYWNVSTCSKIFPSRTMLHILPISVIVLDLATLVLSETFSLPIWSQRLTVSYSSFSYPTKSTISSAYL